ncbi:MAG: hypothetical protein NT092_04225 [Bacteroidia bacterium]|nr:hypothetical protein [Bacteroidia bacterium]
MMQKSPFKFLDSFTKDDREIFFGREKEIEELHSRVFESKVLLVYGTSGTGKSSLINCGLANKFSDSDWLPVSVRRGTDINRSLFEALAKNALTRTPFEKISSSGSSGYNLERLLRSVYLDHFKPVFLIFDQFEELFIFGSKEEKNELIQNVAKVIDSDIQCRFIFSIREEYLAGVTEFERVIHSFLSNRIRIEKMTRQNAIQTIEGPCRINNIDVEPGFAEALLEKLNPDSPEVELTWLQIFLDKIMKLAEDEDHSVKKINIGLLEKAGDVKDILGTFLEEQISKLSDPEAGLVILKAFVSSKGTKHQITEEQVIEYTGTFGKEIGRETVKELIQRFIKLRILRDKNEDGMYELRHDSLASKIYEKITIVEKELLEVKSFIENAYSNYEKRGLLLKEEDLNYIAPYEDKLFLNEKSVKFIEESKQAIHRARRRRQKFAIAAASIIIVILSLFTIWAMKERKNAIKLKQIALEQKDAAVRSKVEADSAKQAALFSQLQAEENAKLAVAARNQSEAARKEAITARGNALQQKSIAEKMSIVASEQAKKAEEEKLVAEQQKILALAAEKEAKRLSLIETAQNIALKSMNMMEWTAELNGLLAVQAFNLNRDNGGSVNDPVIFEALYKSWTVLDKLKHQVFRNSPNEIRSLTERSGELLTADLDGVVRVWKSDGTNVIDPELSVIGPIDFIKFSPSGKYLLYGRENSSLHLKELLSKTKTEFLLTDKAALVMSAAFTCNEKYLAVATTDSLVSVWNIGNPGADAISNFKLESNANCVEFFGNDTLVSAYEYKSDHSEFGLYSYMLIWTSISGKMIGEYNKSKQKPICLKYNPFEKILYVGLSHGEVAKFSGPQEVKNDQMFPLGYSGIDNIAFNSDGSLAAFSCWDKSIKIIDFAKYFLKGDQVGGAIHFKSLNSRSGTMIFDSSDRLISAMSDKTLRIWETSPPKICTAICELARRDISDAEWSEYIGDDIPHQKTCVSATEKKQER